MFICGLLTNLTRKKSPFLLPLVRGNLASTHLAFFSLPSLLFTSFSLSFILILGTIPTENVFDPSHSIILKDKGLLPSSSFLFLDRIVYPSLISIASFSQTSSFSHFFWKLSPPQKNLKQKLIPFPLNNRPSQKPTVLSRSSPLLLFFFFFFLVPFFPPHPPFSWPRPYLE